MAKSSKTKLSKGIFLIGSAVIIILILSFYLINVAGTRLSEQDITLQNKTLTPTVGVTPSISQTTTSGSGFVSYENPTMNFRLDYPSNWNHIFLSSLINDRFDNNADINGSSYMGLNVTVDSTGDLPKFLSAAPGNVVLKLENGITYKKVANLTVNGHEAAEYDIYSPFPGLYQFGYLVSINNENAFDVLFSCSTQKLCDSNQQLFEKIVNSFTSLN